eukprot:Phypoly_transcript_21379.p1 GENE.Phypoly_transcript_21379~~Phypoly_transcript_21379.p1  ORF type:complete len:182 (+),score=33.63 Phypoly_transcript_21379:28-546(+)
MAAPSDIFAEAARTVFSSWTALNLAIDNQWGGPASREKGLEMLNYTVRLFRENNKVYPDELEGYYEQYFSDNFNTEAGDDSPGQVADLLIEVHKECMLGNLDRVRQLIGAPPPASSVAQSRRDNESDDDVSGDEENEDMIDTPPPQPQQPPAPKHVVDEDGWETVTSRKGRR